MKILAKSELVEFCVGLGVFTPPSFFAKKLNFSLSVVNFFVTNFDHLLVLAYPENLSQIGVG